MYLINNTYKNNIIEKVQLFPNNSLKLRAFNLEDLIFIFFFQKLFHHYMVKEFASKVVSESKECKRERKIY